MKPNINQANALRQLQKMQEEVAKAREELKTMDVEESAGGGAVKVAASGDQRITRVTIDPRAVDTDEIDVLEDMIVAAVNAALNKARDLEEARMQSVVGGLGLPGGLGF
jgi:nucleoid-associated protein EbfC